MPYRHLFRRLAQSSGVDAYRLRNFFALRSHNVSGSYSVIWCRPTKRRIASSASRLTVLRHGRCVEFGPHQWGWKSANCPRKISKQGGDGSGSWPSRFGKHLRRVVRGTGGTPEPFATIAHPLEFRRRVQEQIEKLPEGRSATQRVSDN